MATETAPTGATNALAALLPQGTSKTSQSATSSETTKTDLNPDALNEIIRQMMEGDSGLASLLRGQVGGGLYNSSTTQLLANDLAARVAGKAALASAPTTVTKTGSSTSKAPSGRVDPKAALGMQLASLLAGKLFGQGPQTGGGKDAKANSMFDQIFAGVLGKDKKSRDGTDIMDSISGGNAFGTNVGSFDFGGLPVSNLGALGGGGVESRGNNFGGFNSDFGFGGGFGGFGTGGFDSLSFGLSGGDFNSNPFSLMSGGPSSFALGNTFSGGGGFSNFNDPYSSLGSFSGFGGGSGGGFSYEPADFGFSSAGFWG